MNFSTFLLIVTTLCASYSQADVMRGPPSRQVGRGGTCFSYETDSGVMNIGEQVPIPGKCGIAICDESGSVYYITCAPVSIRYDNGCVKGRVAGSSYPECCEASKCTQYRPYPYPRYNSLSQQLTAPNTYRM